MNKLLDERNIVVDDDGNSTNIPTTSKHNESSSEKTDSEKSQNTTRDKLNHENEEKIHKNKESNENHYVEVILDDGNNIVQNTENSKKKESIRRTRFSSEITIQPKAYFQAGVDAVVMMVRRDDTPKKNATTTYFSKGFSTYFSNFPKGLKN